MAVKSICVQAVLAYTALLLCCGLADAAFGKDNVQALHSWFNNQSSLFEPTVISKVFLFAKIFSTCHVKCFKY